MTNTHIEASRNLLTNCSIETTPNVYAKYGKFSDLVDKESNIYVTYLPDEERIKSLILQKNLQLKDTVSSLIYQQEQLLIMMN